MRIYILEISQENVNLESLKIFGTASYGDFWKTTSRYVTTVPINRKVRKVVKRVQGEI